MEISCGPSSWLEGDTTLGITTYVCDQYMQLSLLTLLAPVRGLPRLKVLVGIDCGVVVRDLPQVKDDVYMFCIPYRGEPNGEVDETV